MAYVQYFCSLQLQQRIDQRNCQAPLQQGSSSLIKASQILWYTKRVANYDIFYSYML